MNLVAGQIVLVDWRDALPKEPNKQRPAVLVEDNDLFDETYPNLILVPLAEDLHLAIADLSVLIPPTPNNGCAKPCYALAIMSRPPRSSVSVPPVRVSTARSSSPSGA